MKVKLYNETYDQPFPHLYTNPKRVFIGEFDSAEIAAIELDRLDDEGEYPSNGEIVGVYSDGSEIAYTGDQIWYPNLGEKALFNDLVKSGESGDEIANYYLGYYDEDSTGVNIAYRKRGNFGDLLTLIYIEPTSNQLGGTDEIESGLEISLGINPEEPLFFATVFGISFVKANEIRSALFAADTDEEFNNECKKFDINFTTI